jgi:heat shock protein HspQ
MSFRFSTTTTLVGRCVAWEVLPIPGLPVDLRPHYAVREPRGTSVQKEI